MKKAIFNWSGGKDSSMALEAVLKEGEFQVACLLTSLNKEHDRVSMHGVRRNLLQEQATSLGIPLEILELPSDLDMVSYDRFMADKLEGVLQATEAEYSIFGDIFLEDLRNYRDEKSALVGLKTHYPLWKKDTKKLSTYFIESGFKAITTCVSDKYLSEDFVGRVYDEEFLNDLPDNVDPCGENGEFHTYVYDGPIFNKVISFELGEKIHREYKGKVSSDDVCGGGDEKIPGFWYCDLIPNT